jgi:hypothetical protein
MPNQITSPRPQGEPQTPQDLTLSLDAIKQLDGLYCLNDLHRLSGGKAKDTPSRFIRLDKTQDLIKALQDIETQKATQNLKKGSEIHNPKKGSEKVFEVINGGSMQGVYGNRKIVYAYANWIDPYFYSQVLEVFDQVVTTTASYANRINTLCQELNAMTQCLSLAGRVLAVDGKKTKPQMVKDLNNLLDIQQPQLPNLGE